MNVLLIVFPEHCHGAGDPAPAHGILRVRISRVREKPSVAVERELTLEIRARLTDSA